MRIAVLLTSFPERSNTFTLNHVTGLLNRGHEVDVYADRQGDVRAVHPDVDRHRLLERTFYPSMPQGPVQRMRKGLRLFAGACVDAPLATLHSLSLLHGSCLPTCLVQLYGQASILRRRSYDIIHCHFGPNGVKGCFLRESGHIAGKLITTFHGHDAWSYPRTYGAGVYRQLFRKGDFYTTNTKFTADSAIRLGCPADRIAVLPVGVDLERFPYADRRLAPGEEVRILTVARLVEFKGVEYGIRAVAQLAPRYPALRYQVAGDGPLRQSLETLARRLNVADRVEFLGGQPYDRVVDLFARAHLFLLPGVLTRVGDVEAQGMVLVEAQAAGMPVVASRVGGIPETVLEGESAFLVPPRDVAALAERIGYLIEHPELWPAMGRAGRAYAEQHYDVEKLNDRLVEIYTELLRNP